MQSDDFAKAGVRLFTGRDRLRRELEVALVTPPGDAAVDAAIKGEFVAGVRRDALPLHAPRIPVRWPFNQFRVEPLNGKERTIRREVWRSKSHTR